MAKKFFYNRVYNTKRTIINLVIIGVCIIGVIVCFIITSNFQGENHNTPEGTLSIKEEVTIEVNEEYSNEIFFSKIENVDLDTIEVTYPEDFKLQKAGEYNVTININGKNYDSKLIVVDTIKPELTVKEVTIDSSKKYAVTDFVEGCTDNSGNECIIEFYSEGIDEEGNSINYGNYTKEGTYAIKVAAKDQSDNQVVQETKLTITKANSAGNNNDEEDNKTTETQKPTTTTCKYGSNEYDKDKYLVAVDISSNNCAVSLDLYKDSSMTTEINKLMSTETTRIKKDVEALNLSGTLALNRKVTAVINTTGDGIVGYELKMTVTISKNNKSQTVVEYKVNSNGKRTFITNPHNLSK